MMRTLAVLAGSALLVAAAPVKLAPADDPVTPAPVGMAARTRNGPEPLARPPADVGAAEDPAPGVTPPALATPASTPPPVAPKPASASRTSGSQR